MAAMNDMVWVIVALVVGIALGWASCHFLEAGSARAEAAAARAEAAQARQQADQLRHDRQTMLHAYAALSGEALDKQTKTVEDAASQRMEATELMMAPLRHSVERLEARLGQYEKERVASAAELTNQVRSVHLAGQQMRQEASSLAAALGKPIVRGMWGEVQLKRVVELAGMVDHCDFVTQQSATTDNSRIRPDMKVCLAGGRVVYVDAKTPLEGFLNAEAADSPQDKAAHLASFARAVRSHIDQLGAKAYWKTDADTVDFVIMFLPSEALVSTALDQAPHLLEYAAARQVILASPSTLIATLRTMAYAWTQQGLADSARDIGRLGRQLYERLSTMGGHVDKLGRGLDTAVRCFNEAVGSLEARVLVSARRFHDLGLSEQDLAPPMALTQVTRRLTAPELVSSAEADRDQRPGSALALIASTEPSRPEIRRASG
jgi:DNA recombination protein RmuC